LVAAPVSTGANFFLRLSEPDPDQKKQAARSICQNICPFKTSAFYQAFLIKFNPYSIGKKNSCNDQRKEASDFFAGIAKNCCGSSVAECKKDGSMNVFVCVRNIQPPDRRQLFSGKCKKKDTTAK